MAHNLLARYKGLAALGNGQEQTSRPGFPSLARPGLLHQIPGRDRVARPLRPMDVSRLGVLLLLCLSFATRVGPEQVSVVSF